MSETVTVGTETVERLCGQLIEAVGAGSRHRRLVHGGRDVSKCVACRGIAWHEHELLRQIELATEGKGNGAS